MYFIKNKYDYDIVIIGKQDGGIISSIMSGLYGAKVLLIDKNDFILDENLFLSSAIFKSNLAKDYKNYKNHNLNFLDYAKNEILSSIDDSKFNIEYLMKEIGKVMNKAYVGKQFTNLHKKYGVDFEVGIPKFLNKNKIEINGKVISSKSFIISCGSMSKIPKIEGVVTTNFLKDVDILRGKNIDNVFVIGGGVFGCEITNFLSNMGVKTTIVHPHPNFVNKYDKDVSRLISNNFEKNKVRQLVNYKLVKIDNIENGMKILYLHNNAINKVEKFEAKEIILATGRIPNFSKIDLNEIGIKVEDSGIIVDNYLRSSVKNIFAIGGINNKNSNKQYISLNEALIATKNALFGSFNKIPKNIPNIINLNMKVFEIGDTEIKDNKNIITIKKNFKENDYSNVIDNKEGFIKINISRSGIIKGAVIFCETGYEISSLITMMIQNKINIKSIKNIVLPYPSYSYFLVQILKEFQIERLSKEKLIQIKNIFGFK